MHLANQSTETLAALAMACGAARKLDEARTLTNELESGRDKRYVLPYNFAKIYSACGDVAKTFEWLERAYEDGSPDLIELNSEPIFDPIRGDSRFSELMRRVGWKDATLRRPPG